MQRKPPRSHARLAGAAPLRDPIQKATTERPHTPATSTRTGAQTCSAGLNTDVARTWAGSWSNAGVPWQHVEDSREHSAAATEPALLLLLTRAAETGPRTSWSHQSFATIMEQNNTLSVIMFMAMFGGSTFLLFLLCYCCQRKMRENAFAPLDNATMAHHPQVSTNLAPQTTQIMPSGPPPNYDAVVKKDPADLEPPPYEVAVASLQASGYV